MNIGTLTIHKTINYGAVLQSYALQLVLRNWGYESEVIDYWLDYYGTSLYGSDLIKSDGGYCGIKNKIKESIRDLLTFRHYKAESECRKRRTIEFIDRYIPLSKISYRNYEELTHANKYSFYICGSDQIWNPLCLQRAFTLDFVPKCKKKIAYAASFGSSEIPDALVKTYRELFNNFDAISVREKEGLDIVRQISEKNATWVLDPTLLLNSAKWENLCINIPAKEQYIFCYILGDFRKIASYLKRLCKEMGLKAILLNNDNMGCRCPIGSVKDILRFYQCRKLYKAQEFECHFDSGPLEFIHLLKGSDYVLTDSFHGMALAVALKRPFNVIVNTSPGRLLISSRMKNLAKLLGLEKQIHDELVDIMNLSWDIEWDIVYAQLEKEQVKSERFLKHALSIS